MKKNNLKITVVGSGYVGMSMSVLLSQNNQVTVYDIDENKVKKINNKQSTVQDSLIDEYLLNKELHLSATSNQNEAYTADFVVMAFQLTLMRKIKALILQFLTRK